MKTKDSKSAKAFVEYWQNRGAERQETARFWLELLREVLGVPNPTRVIEFEKPVKLTHTNFIDGYIPATKVLIEQKKAGDDLHKRHPQSDGTTLTPFEQAKRYADELPYSLRPRWIVVCNFQEFLIYDLERPHADPEQILLKDLAKEFYRLRFLVDDGNELIRREEEVSLQAGELVGKLYDALIKEYINPDEQSLRSLNILCVRLVFCLYAEDAGLFATRTSFEDYVKSFNLPDLRDGIVKLFKALDTKPGDRDKYDLKLTPFPYVNGGLFAEDGIEIPNFTQEIVDVIVNHCGPFNWSEISPTIFGAVFESTLNPATRRKGGMHYTSIENIHKVIDPLFLDDLREEFQNIVEAQNSTSLQKRNRKLLDFQNKIASLTFLDPACGSGNFLTETYMSLRRLENEIITVLNKGETVFGFDNEFVKVSINQFYGIEINDFAVTVAKTALWIAECQMAEETEKLVGREIDFLPLKNHANIVEGNALRMDWGTLEEKPVSKALYAEKLNVYKVRDFDEKPLMAEEMSLPYNAIYKELDVITKNLEIKDLQKRERKQVVYDYIIGNPPFSGARLMGKDQKQDVLMTFGEKWKGAGNLDYVTCWYKKSADFIRGTGTRCALLSTNSVSQGSAVANLWKPLFDDGIHIDFAWRTFKWGNETSDKRHMAAVHCVVIGFSEAENKKARIIYTDNEHFVEAENINGYLLDLPNIFIENRKKALCQVPNMVFGSMPNDGGHLIIESDEYADFLRNDPASERFIRLFMGSEEFINGGERYCLWLLDATPSELRNMPLVAERIRAVRLHRFSSTRASTRKLSETPHLFGEIRQPVSGHYLLIPRVSSENRPYIPIGFVDSHVVASDATLIIPGATLFHFGIMESSIHNAWMRTVCGRLKSDYRYSASIVYNNFPWPSIETRNLTSLQDKIGQTAQAILNARDKYSDCTLADLYDNDFMPKPLRDAHRANDKAVMEAYGFRTDMPEEEIVAELFKMYEELTK